MIKKIIKTIKMILKTFTSKSMVGMMIYSSLFVTITGSGYLVRDSFAALPSVTPSPYDDEAMAGLKKQEDPARGIVYDGLRKVKANANHPCKGSFEVEGVKVNGQPVCTHGPDPAPKGVSMQTLTVEESYNRIKKILSEPAKKARVDEVNAGEIIATGPLTETATLNDLPESSLRCGADGKRVVLVVVHENLPQWLVTAYSDSMLNMARKVQTAVQRSALASGTGATTRHIRFKGNNTTGGCPPQVVNFNTQLSDTTSYAEVYTRLKEKGFNRSDRKYLVWVLHKTNFCGLGFLYNDNRPGQENTNNVATGTAMVSHECTFYGELHELFHVFGAVQSSAPNSDKAGHCVQEYDVMCGEYPASGKTTKYNCTRFLDEVYLDCGKNDYFKAAPVPTTNPLYKIWNTANSSWLDKN